MKKRIIAIAVMGVMSLSVFAFAGCDLSSDLSEYKATAETAIQSHAETKIAENSYTEQGLESIEKAVIDGKEAVKNATTKANVDAERDKAVRAIDDVPKKSAGSFYSLQEAYSAGLLTVEDLQSIAYYLNEDSMPVFSEVLAAEVAEKIIRDFAIQADCQDVEHDIQIRYFGTYNGSVAAMIDGCGTGYYNVLDPESIGGVTFYYQTTQKMLIWKEGAKLKEETMQDIELKIREDFLIYLHESGQTEFTIDDVEILKNYGKYGECVVVRMNRGAYQVMTKVTITDVQIQFQDTNTALVWKDGQFYELDEAYDQGFLTKADIVTIADIQNSSLNG